jgi:CO/xanthine dehydrogenase FAD-binding subunit
MNKFEVAAPTSVSSVLSLLSAHGPDAALMAGGTDLLIHIRAGKRLPKLVILLRKVRDLDRTVMVTDEGVTFGALATLMDVAQHPMVRRQFPAIAEAASRVGSDQIRNRGTLCGNVANASPAADTMPPLYVYDAVVNVLGTNGRRSVPIESFVLGPGKTALGSGEIIESIFCPRSIDASSSVYLKLARREGIDIATVGVAALTSAAKIVRVALGAVGPTPVRAAEAEGLLGQGLKDPETFVRGLDALAAAANPITDIRATRDYRLAMVTALAHDAIRASWDRGMATDWGRR